MRCSAQGRVPPSPLQQYTQLRPIQPEDQAQRWDWLHVALWGPPPAIALTVHPQNPAIALYADCGFVDRGKRRGYRLMVASLSEHR